MTKRGIQFEAEAPLSYEESRTTQNLEGTTHATDDGRVDINLDSKLARALAFATRLPEPIDQTELPPPYTRTEWQLPLNIVIQVVGSRGDVQPFMALGQELQRAGHQVRIATHGVFADFVKQAGLRFFCIGGDPAELMAYMVKNPGLIPKMETLREGEIGKKRRMIREMLDGCWNSCIEADPETQEPFVANAIIANPPSFAHIHCAQALGVPVHIMFTMPWTPTQAFPHPLARIRPSKVGEGMANFLSYGLVQILTWQGLADVINDFRESLDLEPVPLTEGAFLSETLSVPHTYCWSPSLVPKPGDWPEHIDVCGFFFRDVPDYQPPELLQDFLSSGKIPIYIGFASIVIDDPDKLTVLVVEAVRLSGVRAIVSAGWSQLGANCGKTSQYVLFLNEDCPHVALSKGSSSRASRWCRNNCLWSSQRTTDNDHTILWRYFWGDMIAQAGAGPLPVRHHELNAQNLKEGIEFCLSSRAASQAARIAEGMKRERGVAAAVASFHRNLKKVALSCDFDSRSPAIWMYRKSGRTMELSGHISEILIRENKVKASDLQTYSPSQITMINQRWDPATAVASSLTSTSIDILMAGNSLWKSPHDMHKKAVKASPDGRMTPKVVTAMVGGSLMSIPRIYGAVAKGFLLDLPLAVTEGMRRAPRLYGEEVRDLDPILDRRNGGVVAGKTFTRNLKESATDLYTLPAQGLQREGVIGLGKVVGKGLVGMVAKTGAAFTGLIAYPAQGIARSIHSTLYTHTRNAIIEAKRAQSRYDVQRVSLDESEMLELFKRFDDLVAR